jgi:hypothetical protein
MEDIRLTVEGGGGCIDIGWENVRLVKSKINTIKRGEKNENLFKTDHAISRFNARF